MQVNTSECGKIPGKYKVNTGEMLGGGDLGVFTCHLLCGGGAVDLAG
jgi:hypothetical protein